MQLKKEIRIIAWDDCAFNREDKTVTLIGAIFRGSRFMDGMLSTMIQKDGTDATDRIVSAIKKSRHMDQLSIIMLDGITFGGFNIVDIKELYEKTGLPVVAVQRRRPDMDSFLAALKVFGDAEERKTIVRRAGELYKFKKIYYQRAGLPEEECGKILEMTCIRSDIPEPLRVAHLIASGLSGESRGRA